MIGVLRLGKIVFAQLDEAGRGRRPEIGCQLQRRDAGPGAFVDVGAKADQFAHEKPALCPVLLAERQLQGAESPGVFGVDVLVEADGATEEAEVALAQGLFQQAGVFDAHAPADKGPGEIHAAPANGAAQEIHAGLGAAYGVEGRALAQQLGCQAAVALLEGDGQRPAGPAKLGTAALLVGIGAVGEQAGGQREAARAHGAGKRRCALGLEVGVGVVEDEVLHGRLVAVAHGLVEGRGAALLRAVEGVRRGAVVEGEVEEPGIARQQEPDKAAVVPPPLVAPGEKSAGVDEGAEHLVVAVGDGQLHGPCVPGVAGDPVDVCAVLDEGQHRRQAVELAGPQEGIARLGARPGQHGRIDVSSGREQAFKGFAAALLHCLLEGFLPERLVGGLHRLCAGHGHGDGRNEDWGEKARQGRHQAVSLSGGGRTEGAGKGGTEQGSLPWQGYQQGLWQATPARPHAQPCR